MKKTISSSLGSQYMLQTAKNKETKTEFPKQLADHDVLTIILSEDITGCCSKGNCLTSLCILPNGNIDYNACVKLFLDCRECTRTKDDIENSEFLLVEFKNSITSDPETTRFQHEFHLLDNNVSVCKKTWGLAYNFTKYNIDLCSSKLKENPQLVKIKTTKYKDSTQHPYNYNETRKIMIDNGLEPGRSNFCMFFLLCELSVTELSTEDYSMYLYL